MSDDDAHVLGKNSGDPRAIAQAIRENTEKAAMLMDPGDVFAAVCTFSVEQTGEVADPKTMREHIARQMAMVAIYICAGDKN